MAATEVKVPDIGDFKDIPVIELLVKPGDTVKKDDSLLVLESDKATMEVPAPAAGVISELKVKIGDKVSAGTLVALLEGNGATATASASSAPAVTNGNGKGEGARRSRRHRSPATAPAAPKNLEPAPARAARRDGRAVRRPEPAPSPTRAPACAGSRASWACRSLR